MKKYTKNSFRDEEEEETIPMERIRRSEFKGESECRRYSLPVIHINLNAFNINVREPMRCQIYGCGPKQRFLG